MIDCSAVAVVLITYYPRWYRGKLRSIKHTDKIRGDLALETIQKAQKLGCRVIVVDGKSTKTFQKGIKTIPNVVICRRKGIRRSPARRAGVLIASKIPEVKVIVLTEAEKTTLVSKCLEDITEPLLKNEADIVVPKRELQLFKTTYPGYMFESEIEANRLYNENLRMHALLSSQNEDFDMFFGPRALRNDKKVIALFMKRFGFALNDALIPKEYFDPEELAGSLFFSVVLALKRKFRVKSVSVPFFYPPLQKENEERGSRDVFEEKRKAQRLGLLIQLMHFIRYLENNASHIRPLKHK